MKYLLIIIVVLMVGCGSPVYKIDPELRKELYLHCLETLKTGKYGASVNQLSQCRYNALSLSETICIKNCSEKRRRRNE